MEIGNVLPNREDVLALLNQSRADIGSLYRPESNQLDNPVELSKPNQKLGYQERTPFGSYEPEPLSLFMEKTVIPNRSIVL